MERIDFNRWVQNIFDSRMWVRFSIALLSFCFFQACSKQKSSNSDNSEPQIDWSKVEGGADEDWLDKYQGQTKADDPPVLEDVELSFAEKLELGKSLYQQNCESCHEQLSVSSKRNRSADVIKNSIIQVLTMKSIESLGELTWEEIGFLEYALDDRNIPDFKSPVPEGFSLKAKVLRGNRKYLASALVDIFGSANEGGFETNLTDMIDKNILGQIAFFGGPCGPKSANCNKSDSGPSGSQMLPEPNPGSSGYLSKTCNSVIAADEAILNMLANASLNIQSEPNDSNLRKLFKLFYPNLVPSVRAIESVKALHLLVEKQSTRDINPWRYVGYSMCSSIALELI